MSLENDYNALMNSCKMLQQVQREQQSTINTLNQHIRQLKVILDKVLSTYRNCDKIELKQKDNTNE